MTTDQTEPIKHINALAQIMSSLRLKEILDAIVIQYSQLTQANKVAVFLADNQGKSFRLMAAKGYSELSLQQMKIIPFANEGILAELLRTNKPILLKLDSQINGFNKTVFEGERSVNQAALPLMAENLVVGAILVDSNGLISIEDSEVWRLTASMTAFTIANAIMFGRSEYEKERLNTLYKILSVFQNNVLDLGQVLQITADAALVLGNTPYCAILLCDEENSELRLAAFKGFEGASLTEFDLSINNTIAAGALKNGTTQQVRNNRQKIVGLPKAMGGELFSSVLGIPLIVNEKKIGVLELFSTDKSAFKHEQVSLLEALSVQASNAVYLAQKHELVAVETMNDPHTGLLNRSHFKAALKTEVERSSRHFHEIAVLFVDIDYLSRINDKLGEETGDEVILKVAHAIKETLREIDLVYRFGGQEFAVILTETLRKDVPAVIERLREKIKNIVIPEIGAVTISIGLSTFPGNSKNAEELIELAELTLYLAKYQGRDRVVEAPISTEDSEKHSWMELAKYAKQAVSAERRERAKSYLSSGADYSKWLLKTKADSKMSLLK